MNRRTFLGTLPASLAAAQSTSWAQTAGRIPRIGYAFLRARVAERDGAFHQGLRDLGWIDKQNISVEYRFAEGKLDRFAAMVAELVQAKIDLIVTSGTTAVRIVSKATRTIPIVMVSGEPVSTHLVASLARPGGNITGLTHVTKDLIGKRLELLKEAVPNANRFAAMLNPENPGEALFANEMESSARALEVKLSLLKVTSAAQFDDAISSAVEQQVQGLMVLEDPIYTSNAKRLADLVARHRLPAVYGTAVFVRAGGLMSYGANFVDLHRRAATYVDKILKGAKPAELPIEQPTHFEMLINSAAAKALGLNLPQSMLLRADKIIQ